MCMIGCLLCFLKVMMFYTDQRNVYYNDTMVDKANHSIIILQVRVTVAQEEEQLSVNQNVIGLTPSFPGPVFLGKTLNPKCPTDGCISV